MFSSYNEFIIEIGVYWQRGQTISLFKVFEHMFNDFVHVFKVFEHTFNDSE